MNLHTPVNEQDQKQGHPTAPLTLVEYGDYQCPHCGNAYPIVKRLQEHFGDKLQFVFRNFPLTNIHPQALDAAHTAEAAGVQDKFWPVHDLIFENQKKLTRRYLLDYAATANADIPQLETDMGSPRITDKVDGDIESGARSGVNGTPTFFINGKRHNGDYSYESIAAALETAL